jgi:hypothetical protein
MLQFQEVLRLLMLSEETQLINFNMKNNFNMIENRENCFHFMQLKS